MKTYFGTGARRGLRATSTRLWEPALTPDDTPSNLDPAVPTTANYPQAGHGSIKPGALFTNTLGVE